MKRYKVWIQIEEVDEEQNHYEDIDLPFEVGCFDDEVSARKFIDDKLITLKEQSPDYPAKLIVLHLLTENGQLWIRPEGYGEKNASDCNGFPVGIELWQGRLRFIVFNDINSEYPQIIDLENARETSRDICNWCKEEIGIYTIKFNGLLFCCDTCLDSYRAAQ